MPENHDYQEQLATQQAQTLASRPMTGEFVPPAPMMDPPQTPTSQLNNYDAVADKIGMIPNVRARDNLFQGIFTAVTMIVGIIIGLFQESSITGAGLGAVGGLVVGVVLSGFVLMIIGLFRK